MSSLSPIRSVFQTSRKLPLRFVLVVPFVIQIFGAVGLVEYLSFRNGQRAVNDVASQLREEISSRIQDRLDRYMATPHLLNELNVRSQALNNLNLQDPTSRERYFWNIIQPFDSVTHTYIGTTKGELFGSKRLSDGSIQIGLADASTNNSLNYYSANSQGSRTSELKTSTANFDARARPWYKAAAAAGKPAWTPIYSDFVSKSLLITGVRPIFDNSGKLEGVFAVNITLTEVNKFLNSLKIGKTGQTFIIERTGELVSTSTFAPVLLVKGKEIERIKASSSQNYLIKSTQQELENRFGSLAQITSSEQFAFSLNGNRQFAQVEPFQDNRGLDWLIVIVVPESDFMAQIDANTRLTVLLCIAALIVATVVGILTARWIADPILNLNKSAKAIAWGDFDRKVEVKGINELEILSQSFNQMAQQLQESFAELETKNTELQRLDQLKDEFLANTSHELKTPLNGIIGIAESLIDGAAGELEELPRNNLALIVTSGRRLSSLVNDILDFCKLRHQNLELQLKPLDLYSIVNLVLTLSKSLAANKKLKLVNAIPADLPPALADENRLQQILHNLVGNAVKFTETGTLEVSAKLVTVESSQLTVNSQLAITVSDTGIGISEDKFDRIFESFEQAEGSTAREYGGTGLGLAITKQLVELQGGQVSVASEVGVGSRFTFTLPVSQGEADRAQSLTAIKETAPHKLSAGIVLPKATLHGKRYKILVVDDEPINLQVIVNNLSLHNYAITQAANGQEALELIESGFIPDIILLDVMMPKMTGYEITEKLRERFNQTELPILLLTAKSQIQDIVTGLNAGANDYLTKPIAKDELLARLRTHINLKYLKAENIRLAAELDVVRTMQQMVLPKESELKAIEGLEIAGFMEPVEEVGGDYYDAIQHPGGVKISIGDVTGHGLESGMLMLMAQTTVRSLLEANVTEPKEFLAVLNRTLYQNVLRINSDKNMTLVLLDYAEGMLTLSGQHEEVIVLRSSGEVERIDTSDLGFPLGLEEDITDFIATVQVQFNSGDVVVLYTDGITEAFDSGKKQYGLDRLVEMVNLHGSRPAAAIREAVIEDVRRHIGEQKVYDDITLVVIKQI